MNAQAGQETLHVGRPPRGDKGHRDEVLGQQGPAGDPAEELAKEDVDPREGRAGKRQDRGRLRVSKGREPRPNRRHNEGQRNSRAGVLRRHDAGQGKDCRADDHPRPEADQVNCPQAGGQLGVLGLID